MEGWKKWYIWIVAVFLLTAVVGKVIMARTPDVGLAGVKTCLLYTSPSPRD